MKILDLYKERQLNEDWVTKYQSTSNNQKGKTFFYVNTNFRSLSAFFNQLDAFKNNDGLKRNEWNHFSNGQELDKHRIKNLTNAGLIVFDGERYFITPKGHEVLRINEDENLSDHEKWVLLLLLLLDYKTDTEDLHIIRAVAGIASELNKNDISGTQFLKHLQSALFTEDKLKLFEKEVFWLVTFAYDNDFINTFIKSSAEDKKQLYDWVVYCSQYKKTEDMITKKFISGGVYLARTFNDDINVMFSILLLMLLQDKDPINYLNIICKIYPNCDYAKLEDFVKDNLDIYKDVYDKSFTILNKRIGVDFMGIDKRLNEIEAALGLADPVAPENGSFEDVLNHNLYGIHIKMNNTALSEDDPHICIGWSSLGDLTSFESKEELRSFYESKNPDSSANSTGQNVGQIWRFIKEANIGDYVILGEKSLIHIGRIVSDYYYDNIVKVGQDSDYVNTRKVEWLKKNIDRSSLSQTFHHSIGSAMSFFTLNDYRSAVIHLLNDTYVKDEPVVEGDEEEIISYDNADRLTGGFNAILYGVPGAGKSWTIKHEYCDDETKMERLVFHPDYTYSDFVGQILPKLDNSGMVTYVFTPGPFTNLLKKAYTNPDSMFYLVIEEVNRGNAPAIFGDIFQLLDRNSAGSSEYKITNNDIAKIVYGDENHKVTIPSNMCILCTMNTSDQNVFTLDTAFQRRWSMRLIKNKFHDTENGESDFANTKILDTDVTWETFFTEINKIILDKNIKMTSSEDKRLGTHFVNEEDLKFDNTKDEKGFMTLKAKMQNSRFPEKVLKYLWDDAFKFTKEDIFDTEKYKSLEDVIEKFISSIGNERFRVFKENIFSSLLPANNN